MREGTAKEIKFESFDSLFGIPKESEQHITTMVPLEELFPYAQHPFRVLDDAKMDELVESIRINGVLEPALVRPRALGGYEIVSGHRRKRACEKAGLEEMPVIIRELTDDESAILMVDSNNQREELLYSEKAWAYRIKYEALKHQGKKLSESSAEQLGKENNKSGRQIKRYIRLTYLQEDLLDLVDQKKIVFRAAEKLSFLTETEQNILLEVILEHKIYPNIDMAEKLKQMSGAVSIEGIEEILLDRKLKNGDIYTRKEYSKIFFRGILCGRNGKENHRAVREMEAGGEICRILSLIIFMVLRQSSSASFGCLRF